MNGITDEEIASTGLQVLKTSIYESNTKKCFRILIKVVTIFMIFFGMKTIEPLNRLTCMYGRVLLFKIEPKWDWHKWYDSSCLMNNPFYKSHPLRQIDCFSCEDISRIERRDDMKSEIIAEKYIRNQIPIIIDSQVMRNDIENWPIADPNLDIQDLEEIYDENDWMNVCMFRTNIRINDHLLLLKKMRTNIYAEMGWYGHWENCDKKTEKKLRKYYLRPKIIPSVLEMTKSNWVLVSKNYNGLHFKLIDPSPGTQVLIMIQIRGRNRIKLEPKTLCSSLGCPTIEETLNQNEMMLMSAKLYNLSYSPIAEKSSKQLNLAIIIGSIYN